MVPLGVRGGHQGRVYSATGTRSGLGVRGLRCPGPPGHTLLKTDELSLGLFTGRAGLWLGDCVYKCWDATCSGFCHTPCVGWRRTRWSEGVALLQGTSFPRS